MAKKRIRVELHTRISKTIHADLVRHSNDKKLKMNDVIESALIEYFHPFDTENHEKYNKMQLARVTKMLIALSNKLDISLICDEEFIKTFYRNTPELVIEDSTAKIAVDARIYDGHNNFMKRVIDSAINNKPNILSALNIDKSEA